MLRDHRESLSEQRAKERCGEDVRAAHRGRELSDDELARIVGGVQKVREAASKRGDHTAWPSMGGPG